MDFTLALMPIQLIRTLNRPLREKILISCLMAMGLLATAIAIIKMTTFKGAFLGDPLSSTVIGSLWAKLEEQVGIIAACIPCLKGPAEKFLHRIGILANRLGHSVELPSFVVPKSQNATPSSMGQMHANIDKTMSEEGDIGSVGSTKSDLTGETLKVVTSDTTVGSGSGSGSVRTKRIDYRRQESV